ncbi:MAG TPA: CoA transferase [Acidimicrobiales bacterium]|jgi:crotonobetainyl-CoA:carnitine CoA-transferase CaiB-like acyl-CoA transferase|nr:CoA transferase [Acidimicrobiales bacterium]
MSEVVAPLTGLAVLDLSSGIAGGYCTKILADGGATVIKVEAPAGDPLRTWSASGTAIPEGDDGALFQYLAASKRSLVIDPDQADPMAQLEELLARADAVIWSSGSPLTDVPELSPASLLASHPQLTVTAITHFGLAGPWSGRAATEFTLQAWSGGVIGLGRGDPTRAPVFVGGQVGAWLSGAYAAVGTMASRRRARTTGTGEIVDVSMLEAIAMCLTYYPVTYFDATSHPFRSKRAVVTPGVGQAKDGMVAVGVGTGQQWLDFCVMVGHPEWEEDKTLFRERGHLAPIIDEWFSRHTVEEIRELATAFRLPNSVIGNGENLPHLDQFEARGSFATTPRDGFTQPRSPFRMQPAILRTPEAAPALGEATAPTFEAKAEAPGSDAGPRPMSGLKVLDMTAFWAGPSCTHMLAMLGADVIHVESIGHVDGTRMLGAPPTVEQWWERSPIFSGLNTNKRSLTLDMQSERGMALLKKLIATADVVVENYTPRVFESVGLTFDLLQSLHDDVVLVRMPGFGLNGPWRDNAAFAYTIEDASGLTWLTGYPDQKPLEPYCLGDPNAGVHALAGLLLALEHRDRTGEAVAVEVAMVDAALNITAEQVLEHSAYGCLLERDGNRGPTAAPQNLYLTSDIDEKGRQDTWAAIAVATDEQWTALVDALGRPEWASDPELATAPGRRARHDQVDEHLSAWCVERSADDVVALLWPAGVPVARVMQPHQQGELEQLQARHFFETVEHPVMGAARYSTMPMRFSQGPSEVHRSPAPLLGQHTIEILKEIGVSDNKIAELHRDGVIGHAPAGTKS